MLGDRPFSDDQAAWPAARLSRRGFLRAGVAAASALNLFPALLRGQTINPSPPDTTGAAAAAITGVEPGKRVLVLIELTGGNDGLNTLVPFGDDAYYRLRGDLAIPANRLIKLPSHDGWGLHAQMRPFHELMGQGAAAIVQGVGYPNPSRSHFVAMDVWQSGTLQGAAAGGWIGRALDQASGAGSGVAPASLGHPATCLCMGGDVPLAARGRRTQPIGFRGASAFAWSGSEPDAELAGIYGRLGEGEAHPSAPAVTGLVRRVAVSGRAMAERLRRAADAAPITQWPEGPLAAQLRVISGFIRAELPVRVYYARLDGFDTHANQLPRHAACLGRFASALRGFYRELQAAGHADRVLSLAFSEFGRRVETNTSGGTDHGAAGLAFLAGPMVAPGLHGSHPGLGALRDGDLVETVDFRSVYASLLDQWMGMDEHEITRHVPAPIMLVRSS